ncbi:hypothetical protein MF406_12085 [Georgenia sp. TF02-10]|uniref:hypothetical protein n=1 Tax=Georgenia sp. TF02-10 TaxID=2917725 RepID=UPI001FA8086D|nr:hypothetical protein [Georgenia sp. TF02-10]UNX53722.1 hypothetical protein MF406_12085 [Georgenia sp. TF02-10]
MGELPAEARDRVRAMALTLVGALVLFGVVVGLYALLVGFDRLEEAPVKAVARAGERELVVQYVGGTPGCGDPDGVTVDESDDAVVLTGRTVLRHATRWGGYACPAVEVPMLTTVRLADPLEGRPVRDGVREVEVTVHDDVAALVEAS